MGLEHIPSYCLGQRINHYSSGGDMFKSDLALPDHLSNVVKIDVYILGPAMILKSPSHTPG